MSSARPNWTKHQSWRRQETIDDKRRSKMVKRIAVTLLGLGLLAILIGMLVWPFFLPRIHIISLAVSEYDVLSAPPISFSSEDRQALGVLQDITVSEEVPRELANLRNAASLKDLLTRELDAIVSGGIGRKTVIFYVTAHGVSELGEAYLLCSDFDPTKADTGRHKLRDMLDQFKAVKADLKLLIFDTGRVQRDPRLGMIVNEFPRLLVKEVEATNDPSLWVLTSNTVLEKSHIAPHFRQSVFGHFVSEGLSGVADLDENHEVDLEELSQFVVGNVSEFVRTQTNGNDTQTPMLVWGGGAGGDLKQALVPVPKDLAAAEAELKAKADKEDEEKDKKEKEKAKEAKTEEPETALRGSHWKTRAISMALGQGALMAFFQTPDAPAKAEGEETEKKETDDKEPAKADAPDKTKTPAKAPAKAPAKTPIKTPEKAPERKPLTSDLGLRKLIFEAWKLRDEFEASQARMDWSPIDQAPHLWREFQDVLWGYELMSRAGDSLDDKRADNVAKSLAADLNRMRKLLEDQPIRENVVDRTTISRRMVDAYPQPNAELLNPCSLAMAEQYPWPLGAALPKMLAQTADELDQRLNVDIRLFPKAPDEFFQWVEKLPPDTVNLLELRLAKQLTLRKEVVNWELLKQALQVRRLGEQAVAQTYYFSSPSAVSGDWGPAWIKTLIKNGDKDRREAERILLTGSPDQFERAADRLQSARADYERVMADLRVIHEARQVKNRLLFRLPYYVRWHCSPGVSLPDNPRVAADAPAAADIKRMIEDLKQLVKLKLDDSGSTINDLARRSESLIRQQEQIEQALSESVIDELTLNPHLEGNMWKIQILLSTPLPSSEMRERLLAAYDKVQPLGDRLKSQIKDLNPTFATGKAQVAPAWEPIFEQAELESLLVDLAEAIGTPSPSAAGKKVDDSFAALKEANEQFMQVQSDVSEAALWDAYAEYGESLKQFYIALPSASLKLEKTAPVYDNPKEPEQLLQRLQMCGIAEHELRFVTALDAKALSNSHCIVQNHTGRLHGLLLWQEARLLQTRQDTIEQELGFLTEAITSQHRQASALLPTPLVELPALVHVDLEGPKKLKLSPDAYGELPIRVRASGRPETKAWVVLQYDPNLLEVEGLPRSSYVDQHSMRGEPDSDTERPHLRLFDTEARLLNVQLRAKQLVDATVPFILKVKVDGIYYEQRVEVEMPPPEPVTLVVDGIDGSWAEEKHRMLLYPFPNQKTEYRFSLVNSTKKAKKVRVEWMALAAPLSGRRVSEEMPFDAAGNLQLGVRRPTSLLVLPEVTLPPDGEKVAIPFPPPPEAAPPKEPGPPVETRPVLDHGIVLVISDDANRQRIIKRVDIYPQRPIRYLQPTVGYDYNQGRIEVRVKPRNVNWLPVEGSKIEWQIGSDIPANAKMKVEGVVRAPDYLAYLYVDIGPQTDRIVTVNLKVDGYPRAFVYRVSLDDQKSSFPVEEDLQSIRVVSPKSGTPYPPVDTIPVVFEVDSPVNSFQDDLSDVIEVGLDGGNRTFDPGERTLKFYNDRQLNIFFDGAKPGGMVRLEAKVSDFHLDLPTGGVTNMWMNILGRIQVGEENVWNDDSRPRVVIDGADPVVRKIEFSGRGKVLKGDEVKLMISASDLDDAGVELSGVDKVEVAFDPDRLGNFGEGKKPELARLDINDAQSRWMAALKTDMLRAGEYDIIVRATDRVNNESKFAKTVVSIVEPPPPTKDPLPGDKVENDVLGVALDLGNPAKKIKITLNGSEKDPITTSENGQFIFKDLPPGKYEIIAEGIVGNKIVKKTVPIQVTSPPAPPTKVRVSMR